MAGFKSTMYGLERLAGVERRLTKLEERAGR
jgi:hypothetical protein